MNSSVSSDSSAKVSPSDTQCQFDRFLEYMGALSAVLGVLLVAMNLPFSSWGWVIALLSNLFLIPFTWRRNLKGLLGMQFCFLGINLLGLIRHFDGLGISF